MGQVNCLYCGQRISDDQARCPHCGAASHFQSRGYRLGARSRFILLFSLLVLVVFVLVVYPVSACGLL